MKQIIARDGNVAKFVIYWLDNKNNRINDSVVHLDFSPFINQFHLSDNFVFLHFQAKPKLYRQWGLYDGLTDTYYSRTYEQIAIQKFSNIRLLHINEQQAVTVPTGVILFSDAKVYLNSSMAVVS